MSTVWDIIDAAVWMAVGAAGYAFYWRGTHACIDAIGGSLCRMHDFNLHQALGML